LNCTYTSIVPDFGISVISFLRLITQRRQLRMSILSLISPLDDVVENLGLNEDLLTQLDVSLEDLMDMLDDDREDLDGKDAANSGEDAAIYGLATLYYWHPFPILFF